MTGQQEYKVQQIHRPSFKNARRGTAARQMDYAFPTHFPLSPCPSPFITRLGERSAPPDQANVEQRR